LQWNARRCAWSKFKSVRVERKIFRAAVLSNICMGWWSCAWDIKEYNICMPCSTPI
jgi:hypothetical protein